MGYINKTTLLSSLTIEDITYIVVKLGSLPPKKDSKGNLIFQTVCHNMPSSNMSWKLYYMIPDSEHQYGLFHCYTKCGDWFDIIELVIRAKRIQGKTITWFKALYWIAQQTNKLDLDNIQVETKVVNNDLSWLSKFHINSHSTKDNQIVNENVLDIFNYNPHELWLNNNISREALSRYEISYYGLTNQIVIPHRDKDNNLIGIRGRFIDSEDMEIHGKYMPLFINGRYYNHSLGNNLYGLNVVQDKIRATHKVMLVEGEKSCLQAYSYFGDDSFVVAVCGSNISYVQISMLMQLGVEEVIIAFDKEYQTSDSYEAEIYYNKLLKKAKDIIPYCNVSLVMDRQGLLEYKDSPTDKGKDILCQLMEDKIRISKADINNINK